MTRKERPPIGTVMARPCSTLPVTGPRQAAALGADRGDAAGPRCSEREFAFAFNTGLSRFRWIHCGAQTPPLDLWRSFHQGDRDVGQARIPCRRPWHGTGRTAETADPRDPTGADLAYQALERCRTTRRAGASAATLLPRTGPG